MPDPSKSVTLRVLDADGTNLGDVEDIELSVLAHRLPVKLEASAQEALGVEGGSVELPAQLIQQRSADEVTLSRTLEGIRELLEDA